MSLPYEYFKNHTHIKDLQKLKDDELYYIIKLFYKELLYFNESEGFKLKGLIIACNETKDLINEFRFILNGFINVNKENCYTYCFHSDIEQLLSDMDKIENQLNKIKSVRLLKKSVNDLVDSCLLNIRLFYSFLNEIIPKWKYAYGIPDNIILFKHKFK